MTTLHDRLADLADEVDTSPGATAPHLWRDGRARARRQRVAAAAAGVAAVALVAAVTGAVTTRLHAQEVAPAGQTATPAMPDQIFTGSSWLPHGSEHGAGGPLAAVYADARTTWTGGQQDLLAVSAVGQDYRWLDLPGFAGYQFSLSPDGQYLAYLTEADEGLVLHTVDTRTGEAHSNVFEGPPKATTMAWTGDLVWICPGDPCRVLHQIHAGTGASAGKVPPPKPTFGYVPGPDDSATLLVRTPYRASVFEIHEDGSGADTELTQVDEVVDGVAMPIDSAALSPDGTSLVVIRGGEVRAGRMVRGGTTTTDLVGDGVHLATLVGWVDDTHVVGHAVESAGESLVSVDITTGEQRTLVRLPESTYPRVAAHLLAAPTVPGVTPPTPLDPRYSAAGVAGGAGGAALLAVLGVWLWRRRALR